MKIGVVADTHNNWANFKKAIEWMNKENIQLILHCGDICSQETIDQANKLFTGEVKYVKGNADFELDLSRLPEGNRGSSTKSGPEKLEIVVEGKRIAFTHFPDIAKKLVKTGKFDLVFYGHTHRPWDEKIACLPAGRVSCHMINPGEMAGQFYKPTFAVYDTETSSLELKILELL